MSESDERLAPAHTVLITNLFLIGIKLAVVLLTGSIAVIAILTDSLLDLLGGLFVYFGMKKAGQPADESHPYGHKKYETVSALGQSALIVLTAFLIAAEAVRRLISPIHLDVNSIALVLVFFTILVDIGLALYLTKEAKRHGSLALDAARTNYTYDIFQNSTAFIGLFAVQYGIPSADPIAALVLSVLMLRGTWGILSTALDELTDGIGNKDRLAEIKRAISSVPAAKSYHKLRARAVAGKLMVDLHLHLPENYTLKKGHEIAAKVKYEIMKAVADVKEVLVHVEPLEEQTGKK